MQTHYTNPKLLCNYKRIMEVATIPVKPKKKLMIDVEDDAALEGGPSAVGDGVGFIWAGASGGGDCGSSTGAGGGEEYCLVLSANTTTTNFSFLRQLSLIPLMK